jgi:leucyl aminopeptidase
MKIVGWKSFQTRKSFDCLVLPFFQEGKKAIKAFSQKELDALFLEPLRLGDFSGKREETFFLYANDLKEKRILLLGMGSASDLTQENMRSIMAAANLALRSKKISSANVLFPALPKSVSKDLMRSLCEGLLLSNYAFDKLKQEEESKKTLLSEVTLIGVEQKDLLFLEQDQILADSVHLVRDLVNDNADFVTPQMLAKTAKDLEKLSKKIKVTVFDKKRIEKEKMGLLLAVSKGAFVDPTFTVIEYAGSSSTNPVVLVGKGLTYDTGGLSLKPTTSMETMKSDMAGAAAVIGTMRALALLDLPVHVVGLIPSTENAIGSRSYKPGDVYMSYSGKSVEVMNTDAEGRLVLADALAYGVKHYKPSYMIDIATLTGAVSIALGEEIAGFFATDEHLAKQIEKASQATGELLWRLPLYAPYLEQLKSDIADLKNIGNGKGGSIMGALFLKEFVGKVPWAHIDIGSSSWLAKPKGYYTSHATGVGVRLFINFLESLGKKS